MSDQLHQHLHQSIDLQIMALYIMALQILVLQIQALQILALQVINFDKKIKSFL